MKSIGLIAGFSPYSSAMYYQKMIDQFHCRLKNVSTPDIFFHHLNPSPIIHAVHHREWDTVFSTMKTAAIRLLDMGSQCIVIPCNSLHSLFFDLQSEIPIPVINIMQSVGVYALQCRMSTVLLLGTLFTMESDFYVEYLEKNFNLLVITPEKSDRYRLHELIFEKLCKGDFSQSVKDDVISIINSMNNAIAIDGVILGCTELSVLFSNHQKNFYVDSLNLHVHDIVQFSIGNDLQCQN